MNSIKNGAFGSAGVQMHESPSDESAAIGHDRMPNLTTSPELRRSLAEIKGQAQFLLYLADQVEESLGQLVNEVDPCHNAFLCKVLGMYSGQLESKHQGLGEKIAEACQEIYVTVREREMV